VIRYCVCASHGRGESGLRIVLIAVLASIARVPSARADKVDDLVQTLSSTDSYKVKVQACLVLGKSGDTRAVGPLIQALRDPTPVVRMVAAQALGRIGDAAALPVLELATQDPVSSVAETARQAIAILRKAAVAPVYVSVGKLANHSKGGGPDVVRLF